MKMMNKTQFIAVAIAILLAIVLSAAGSDGGMTHKAYPVFAICVALAFAVNWLAFIPANIAQTERYYDLTGSLTYLAVIATAVLLTDAQHLRAVIVAALVVIWALRLGSFLFSRIQRDGADDRFDEIKINPGRFFVAWTLQALWVSFTAAAALAVITTAEQPPLSVIGLLGIALWVAGFAIEVTADAQKSRFKTDPDNHGLFISTGLWAWSRHPNYFGEMLLWTGIAVIALPVLHGWQWLTLISPVFVFVLIRYISGVNKLEVKAEERWGTDTDYQQYKKNTSLLMLLPPKRK